MNRFLKLVGNLLPWLVVDRSRRRRLRAEIDISQSDLAQFSATHQQAEWFKAATASLKNATDAWQNSDLSSGWAHLFAAERHMLEVMPLRDLEARREALLKEASSKLDSWRQQTVLAILGAGSPHAKRGKAAAEDESALRARLREATRIRDDHFGNLYRKTDIRRALLFTTALILTFAMLALYSLAADAPTESAVKPTAIYQVLGDRASLLIVILAGLFGALISTAISLVDERFNAKRVPEHIASLYMTLTRPVFGASFAVAVYVAMQSGVVSVFDDNAPAKVLAAFLAGFSERWFLGVVGAGIAKKPS